MTNGHKIQSKIKVLDAVGLKILCVPSVVNVKGIWKDWLISTVRKWGGEVQYLYMRLLRIESSFQKDQIHCSLMTYSFSFTPKLWHPFVIGSVKVSGMGLLPFKMYSHNLSLCLQLLIRASDEYNLLWQCLFLQNFIITAASENYQSPLRKLTFLVCFWKLCQQWG